MKKKTKKFYILLCITILSMLCLCGCKSDPKTFVLDNFSITLTQEFSKSQMSEFDAYIVSEDVIFSAKCETNSELEFAGYEIASLQDYAKEICSLNSVSTNDLTERNGYYYFTNSATVSGASYTYLHCMFAQENRYWIFEFVSKTKHFERQQDDMLAWADSITFR